MSAVTDFKQIADEARGRLIAELHRTTETADAGELLSRLETLRRLTTELLERATELQREVARLSEAVERPVPPIAERRSPLDVLDSVRESIAEVPIDFGPARRRRFEPASEPAAELSEGVRVFVEQMRIAGEDDVAIAKYLEQIGVKNPATVVARVARGEDSLTS